MRIAIATFLTCLIVAPSIAPAQKIPVEAIAGVEALGARIVDAINDTSVQARRQIVRDVYAVATLEKPGEEALLAQIDRFHNELAPLEYHHSEVVTKALHVYARTQGMNNWRDFQFYVQTEPPYKIERMIFLAEVAEPVYLPNGDLTDPMTIDWLNGYIDKLIAANDLTASLLIAKGDIPIFERYFGYVDSARTKRATADTPFNLGSGNKMFTALAVMMLKEEGRLRLDDPLIKYFPDFPDTAFASHATIHNLLSHTSGLGDYWDAEYEKHWHEYTRLGELLPKIYSDGTDFEPGSAFQYSNSGFILAGLIVEKVSGEDYFDFVRERITKPSGMTHTDSYIRDGSVSGLAEPLARRGDGKGWRIAPHGLRGTSAGGGYSTPRDMLKFTRSLSRGALVNTDDLRDMTTPKNSALEPGYLYGYGFIIQKSDAGIPSYGHGGIASGINFYLHYFPTLDVTFVIFCNQDNGAYDDLRKNIVKLITGDR